MKTILIPILLILISLQCLVGTSYSQRITVPPYTSSHFNGKNYSVQVIHNNIVTRTDTFAVNINFADTSVFQNTMDNFLFGYHWGGGTNSIMERRWHINMPMNHYGWTNGRGVSGEINEEFDSLSLFAETALPGRKQYVIWKYNHIPDSLFDAPALTWHPAAPNTPEDVIFQPIASDTTGAAFGFAVQHSGRQIRTQGNPNFMRYVLTPDSVTNGSVLCLQKPMLHTKVNKYNTTVSAINDLTSNDAIESRKNGTKWYLSVNLKRLDSSNIQADTARVLGIVVRYTTYNKNQGQSITKSIRFDSTFNYQNTTDTLHHARGITHRNLHAPTGADTNTFFIRRKDIPQYGSVDSLRDICLSAFFRTSSSADSGTKRAPNPHFSTKDAKLGSGDIDSIDIQVTYYGNCPVSVSHITLQTPQTREFLWGHHDTTLAIGVDRTIKNIKRIQAIIP